MAVAQGPFLAAVLLLVSLELHSSSPLPACPEPCTCQRAPLLNCSSSGLLSVPQGIQDPVTELDLSHNLLNSVTLDRPHQNLKNVWLGNNSITHLSLCIERNLGGRYVRGRQLHRLRPWSRQACVSWAPTLQLLSVERNQLEQLPEGLEGSESLQILQLSFNRISTLRPGDFSRLQQLIEIHLQHNLITNLHPQMFQDLAQLRVLDLSFNKLTSLHSLMYLSLHNIGADVRLAGNKWQCDCSMRSLRRRMAYDSTRGLQAWSVVCASPSNISGRDLLHLEEDDLNCFSGEKGPELHQDVTVYSGSEILLSCSTQDSILWTPSGQASVSQPQAGLLVNDITESDTGLYLCVSEEHEVASVFNLQISKVQDARRKLRSLPRTSRQIIPQSTQNKGQERNQQVTQSDFALAVCLSVFITFLIAFILGVLARPCIDVLWRRITSKNNSTETHSVSSVEQEQYDNEAYVNGEEQREMGTHRERRVTFSNVDLRDNNVQYYDTVANVDQESINSDAVTDGEAAMAEIYTHTAGDSGSDNSSQQSCAEENQRDVRDLSSVMGAGCTHNIEFEHIPDSIDLEKRRSLSSSSDSSLSSKELNEDQMTKRGSSTPKPPQLAEDNVQQNADFLTGRAVEVPQITIVGSNIPGFSSEPFADWSPHTKSPNLSDPDLSQENEEQFDFSDSVSTSVRGSFNSKNIVARTSDKQKRDDMSSSSSYMSEDEPREYTVNSDQELSNVRHDAGFQQQVHSVDPNIPPVGHDAQRHAVTPKHSFSSYSSDSDGEDYTTKQEANKGKGKDRSICVSDKLSSRIVTEDNNTRKKVQPMPTKWRVPSLGVISHGKATRAPPPPAAYLSSSSSESKREITDLKVQHNTGRVKDLSQVTPINKHVDIRAPSPPNDSSSSIESADEMMDQRQKSESKKVSHGSDKLWPGGDLEHTTHIKRLDIKAPSQPSDSSSSSDSENETIHGTERPGQVDTAENAFRKSQTLNTWWPALDLEHIPHIKRRLDIKPSSPDSGPLSSSDSEDETMGHTMKQRPAKLDIAGLPFQDSQKVRLEKETLWPAVDVDNSTHIKRRLDIKAPSVASDSSSSSDSEDETTNHIKKQGHSKIYMARPPVNTSQPASNDPQTQWPALDLEHTPRFKRRLDIKVPSLNSDSSSSSDSEDETTSHTVKQRTAKLDIAGLPFQESQTVRLEKETLWPAVDLDRITRIKRRLDIKAPSVASDSSSSSDSEDETTNQIKKQGHNKIYMARPPVNTSQPASNDPQTLWPALDLEHTTHVKRRLDIKAPSLNSDSSSSSDSENETMGHTVKQRTAKLDIAGLPSQESQTVRHDKETRWPALDLDHFTRIKRRLEIKVPSAASDSSSSSDSEDETTNHIKKQGHNKIYMARPPVNTSQPASNDPQTQWPALDLEHTTRVKRRLDIKVPSPNPDSSSSSDSEDETTNHIKKQGHNKIDMAKPPVNTSQPASNDPQTQWPALDLEHMTHVKRRLDIKAPSLNSDSSSSSDSEDETMGHTVKQRTAKLDIAGLPFQESQTVRHDKETRWPALDLDHFTHIKRRLEIKAPSEASDSSSSSDSEDETINHIKKQGHNKIYMARPPVNTSQPASNDPQTLWPALHLEHAPRLKRRLDIKVPSPNSDSSSSSDSEDETTSHTMKQRTTKLDIAGLPIQESQTVRLEKETLWPAVDLDRITHIKRRLEIKAPSAASDSSSSSDSEDETTNHIKKQGHNKIYMARPPVNTSQTASNDPQTQWPALDLEHTPRLKRRLDIKVPSPNSDSSSSSDSEDETTSHTVKQRTAKLDIAGLPFQESQTVRHDKETRWPALDLEHTTHVKRHLDIKALSLNSDSSSSSDSEDETTGHTVKQRTAKLDIAGLPFQESQTVRLEKETLWPAVDLDHITRIKRRLDIKAPSEASDSSSSSDSEDETTNHIKKQGHNKIYMARPPVNTSQPASNDPQTQWPALDLEHTTRVKRRLDIKAPSPASESSSSSDDETTHQTMERLKLVKTGGLFQQSQKVSHDPQTQWPVVDLGNIVHIKRRLDIKAPSPHPESVLSGANTNLMKAEKIEEAVKMSPHYSSSSSDSEEEGMDSVRNPPTTVEANPNLRWPQLGLSGASRVKRRLDIRAHSPAPLSSSSSNESDGRRTDLPVRAGGTDEEIKSYELGAKFSDMRIPLVKKRLNIKAPSQQADSWSSSSDNESRISSHTVKHERDKIDVGTTNYEQQEKLHKLSPGIPHISRRLDIKAPSPQPHPILTGVSAGSQQSESNSSSSDSEDESRGQAKPVKGVSAISKTSMVHSSHNPKTHHNIKLEKYTVITEEVEGKTTSDNINTIPKIDPELESRWATMNLGISRFRKRLEITSQPPNLPSSHPSDSQVSSSSEKGTGSKSSKTRRTRGVGMQRIIDRESSLTPDNKSLDASLHIETDFGTPHFRIHLDSEKAPAVDIAPLQQVPDSSSSSENENASTEHGSKGWRGIPQPVIPDKEASRPMSVAQPVNIKLDPSHTQIDKVQKVELKGQTPKMEDEFDSVLPQFSLSNIPYYRRALDIKAPLQSEASLSSNRENEMTDHSVPDLSLGVPHVKKHFKAPSLEQSSSASSCSDTENEVIGNTANQSRHASEIRDHDSPITYKRLIFKGSLPMNNSFSHSGSTVDQTNQRNTGAEMTVSREGLLHGVRGSEASLAPGRVPSVDFDDARKKRIEQSRSTTDVDLAPEIRWTGIGHQLSDLSISSQRRRMNTSIPKQATPAERTPFDTYNYSSSKIQQDRRNANGTLMQKYSSPSARTDFLASSRTFDKFDKSPELYTSENWMTEARRERKGLSALKAMSSGRQKWDTQAEKSDMGASSLFDDHGQQVVTSLKYHSAEEDIKPLAKQALTQLHLNSTPADEQRATDMLYDIPRYRKHDIGGIETPHEAPPPIPATRPPDEVVALTWRTPESSKKLGMEGTRSYLQQNRNTKETDLSSVTSQNLPVYVDSSNANISHV